MSLEPITIVGGGLAGLTLGIALRREGVPVRLIEAGVYPRHRVCGEFISGRGLEVLARFGVMPMLRQAGGRDAATAHFHLEAGGSLQRRLPQKAFCISRFLLDSTLIEVYRRLGGTLTVGERWMKPFNVPGIVRATGRRVAAGDRPSRWFGLKAHAWGVCLDSDLEMHVGPRGYVGLCRVEGDRVNVCGLFREPPAAGVDPQDPVERFGSGVTGALRQRLSAAAWDEGSFCAVGGLPIHVGLRPREEVAGECAVGDAVAMIPPLTGNGMSIALETAWLTKSLLAEFSRGQIGWIACCNAVARLQGRVLGSRLGRANRLHRFLTSRSGCAQRVVGLAARWKLTWEWAYRATR